MLCFASTTKLGGKQVRDCSCRVRLFLLEVLKVLHEAENCHSSVHLFMKQSRHLPKAYSESVAMFNRYAWDLDCTFTVLVWHSVTTLKFKRGKKNMRLNDYNKCKIHNQILSSLIFIIYMTLWKHNLIMGLFFCLFSSLKSC